MIYFLRLIFHIFLVKMTYSSEPFGNCSARHLLKDGLFFFPQWYYAKYLCKVNPLSDFQLEILGLYSN